MTTQTSSRLRASAEMVGATVFWALNYQISAIVLQQMSPVGLTFWRWMIAAVPLLVLAQIIERPDWRAVARALPRLVVLSLLGLVAYNLLLYMALHYTTPVGASLVNAGNPALMVMLSVLLVGQHVSKTGVGGIVLSLVGVLLVLTEGSWQTIAELDFNVGQIIMLGAILVWSLYTIYGRVPGVRPITSTAVQAVLVCVMLGPVAAVQGAGLPLGDSGATIGLIVIALLPSVCSYLLWNSAVSIVPSSTAAIYLNLITVFVVIIGLVAGQPLTLSAAVGGLLVIVGVVITSLAARRVPA
ncbi:DMT family transporter [Pseudoclavibacter sp. 13-3]|uniref:DMT family transporter n=1 Tax=Pseudoclavibacter sp. 13-3 TaxID=2901228 RepID=UPI001E2B0AFC|nr:DMT family transporter [Pseudoclavibacter sp. 13-3]MCD7100949.1 DMT family transporter [Pseudoclavibacter sp. 13-3]